MAEKYNEGEGLCWKQSEWCSYNIALNNVLGYITGLWSRLAEIGIRTIFIVLASTAALLFKELDERMEKIEKKSEADPDLDRLQQSTKLNEWRRHYDLICELVELINRCFGFSLLLITMHDFATSIYDFSNLLDLIRVSKHHTDFNNVPNKWKTYYSIDYVLGLDEKVVIFKSDPIKTFQFAQPVLRYFMILVSSHDVGCKVRRSKVVVF